MLSPQGAHSLMEETETKPMTECNGNERGMVSKHTFSSQGDTSRRTKTS